jgi:hypothetical protein
MSSIGSLLMTKAVGFGRTLQIMKIMESLALRAGSILLTASCGFTPFEVSYQHRDWNQTIRAGTGDAVAQSTSKVSLILSIRNEGTLSSVIGDKDVGRPAK